jgi:hypothetical protein
MIWNMASKDILKVGCSSMAVSIQGFAKDPMPVNFQGDPSTIIMETTLSLGNPSTFDLDIEGLLLLNKDYTQLLFSIPPPPVLLTKAPIANSSDSLI